MDELDYGIAYQLVFDLDNPAAAEWTHDSLLGRFKYTDNRFKRASASGRDWRQTEISIYSLDMTEETSASTLGPLKSVYLGHGVVRLFRDDEQKYKDIDQKSIGNDDGSVVAILAVPSYFSPTDILGFVGPKAQERVLHFRMIRTSTANRYMVLIKFREPQHAQWFMAEYNGKLFNSMEAETCQVVIIKAIHFQSHVKAGNDEIPYLLEDTFTRSSTTTASTTATATATATPEETTSAFSSGSAKASSSVTTSASSASASTSVNSSRPDPPPPPSSLRELPSCPVCLERMDSSVTGLLTILCQHTFHCQCLSKWGDGSCPVCRYSQQGKSEEPAECSVCGSTANPWVCLICGNVGCGRYDSAHAKQHYMESQHCYSMDVNTQRVWDYASDAYVHRLIQNPDDGKLVETSNSKKNEEEDVALQYTHLLTSQLESQRSYYEDLMMVASARADKAEKALSQLQSDLHKMRLTNDELAQYETQSKQKDNELENAKKKAADLHQMYTKLIQSYKEEKAMAEKMVNKLESVEEEKHQLKAQVDDLEGQVKDLMFYLDAQSKLQDAGEDVQQGQVVVKDSKKKNKKRAAK